MEDDFDFNFPPTNRQQHSSRRRNDNEDDQNANTVPDRGNNNESPLSDDLELTGGEGEGTRGTRGKDSRKAMSGWQSSRRSDQQGHGQGHQQLTTTANDNNNNNNNELLESLNGQGGVSLRRINDQEDEMEIPEIPDLDEQADTTEDMAFQIAEAPDVQVHQIATYKELDKEFYKEKAFQFLEGNIDVSLLHCGLSTEQQIAEEEDVVWEWTKLFTEVVSTCQILHENDDDDDDDDHDHADHNDLNERSKSNHNGRGKNVDVFDTLGETSRAHNSRQRGGGMRAPGSPSFSSSYSSSKPNVDSIEAGFGNVGGGGGGNVGKGRTTNEDFDSNDMGLYNVLKNSSSSSRRQTGERAAQDNQMRDLNREISF